MRAPVIASIWFLTKVPSATPTIPRIAPETTAASRVLINTSFVGLAASGKNERAVQPAARPAAVAITITSMPPMAAIASLVANTVPRFGAVRKVATAVPCQNSPDINMMPMMIAKK